MQKPVIWADDSKGHGFMSGIDTYSPANLNEMETNQTVLSPLPDQELSIQNIDAS